MSSGKVSLAAALLLSFASSAHAEVCLVAQDPALVERAVVIESPASPAPALWLTVEMAGKTRLAWLIDNAAEATFEPRGQALLEALEAQTAPQFAPSVIPGSACARVAMPPTSARGRTSARRFDVLPDDDALARWRSTFGGPDTHCKLQPPVQLVEFEAPEGRSQTQSLRVFGAGQAGFAASFRARVTFMSIAPGRVAWPGVPEIGADGLGTTYLLLPRTNTYDFDLDRTFSTARGPLSVLESVLPLFRLDGAAGNRFPLLTAYFREAGEPGADACSANLEARLAIDAGLPFAEACASPAPLPSDWPAQRECEAVGIPGTIPAAALRCGAADDLALALAGLNAKEAWVTRATAMVVPGEVRALSFEAPVQRGPSYLPLSIDSTGCVAVSGPSTSPSPQPAPTSPPWQPAGPIESISEWDGVTYERDASCGCDGTVGTEGSESCSGSSEPSNDDSCSGSSEPSNDDSCSGSSEPSSEDSCSGDTSDSQEEDGSCSGDSSKPSSSSDDSCSGSASSDEEGDSCTQRSASSSAALSSPTPRRGRQTRASVWTLALSSLWLPVRRFGRRRRGRPN